ncbi:MAG: NAD(+)/NADH kinase [Nitrolancea sp.]
MSLTIGLIVARDKHEAAEIAEDVERWLADAGVTVRSETELLAGASVDLLVTLGGDGLIMRMAHVFPNVPILGINVGKVGFLARIEREDWRQALTDIIERRYRVQITPTLNATLIHDDLKSESFWAINDVVIRSGLQMIDVELYIDQQFVNTYPGDGMIVATPQGSTAYCMAAGGPVLDAGVRGFAVTPICAHSPIRTTLVVPEEVNLELVMASDRVADLILDGTPVESLTQGDVVQVHKGEHLFHLIILEGMNFYQAFRSKFNFMIRPNAVPTRPPARTS